MKIEVRPLRDTDIEELSRIEAASFSMPWSAEDFRGLLLRDYCLYVVAETDGHAATGGRAWYYGIYIGSQSEQCTGDPFI